MARTERAAGFYVGDRGQRTAGIRIRLVLVAAARGFFSDFAQQSRGSLDVGAPGEGSCIGE